MVQSLRLPNGIRLVTERIPQADTVSVGFWVDIGSSAEQPAQNGYTHFIEHMLFKGADGLTAYDIARQVDSVGGVMNAFTTREMTCFYVNVVAEHALMVIELLRRMYYKADFDSAELERERQVIMQELLMYEDTPDEYIHDRFITSIWPRHAVGAPIAGTVATVSALTRTKLNNFYRTNYTSDRLVVAVAGKFDHDAVAAELATYPATGMGKTAARTGPFHKPRFILDSREKELEQVHLIFGFPAVSAVDERRHALYLLNQILGGGMSSRLYQRIREREGNCYSIYSFPSLFRQQGIFAVYCATSLPFVGKVLTGVREELLRILEEGIDETELHFAKQQMRGNIMLGRESIEGRMNRLAVQELVFGTQETILALLKKIDRVSVRDIRDAAAATLGSPRFALTTIGGKKHLAPVEKFYGAGVLHG